MLIRLWRMRRDEDGQAIVIAAVGLLIIAFLVLGTATLGNAIHEKVRLQNAADSAAYSLAAVEARAFNYYAFTNRVMASHYSAIMILQSYLAVAGFVISAVNTVLVVFLFLDKFCDSRCGKPICKALESLPTVGSLVVLIQRVIDVVTRVLQSWQEWLDRLMWGDINLDKLVGWVAVPSFVALNWILYLSQLAMMSVTTSTVAGSGRQFVEKSYDGTGRPPPRLNLLASSATAVMNFRDWNRAHDPEAMNGTPSSPAGRTALKDRLARDMDSLEPGVKRAERVMTEISNATRWNGFVFNRSLEGRRSILDSVSQASAGIVRFETHGSTKMLTESWPDWNVNRRTGYDAHDMRGSTNIHGHTFSPQGGSIVGDQWLEIGLFFLDYNTTEDKLKIGWGAFSYRKTFSPNTRHSAIAASHEDFSPRSRWGWHCVTRLTPPNRSLCLLKAGPLCICKVKRLRLIDTRASRCDAPEKNEHASGNHPWWGVVPFMKFDPEPDGSPSVNFHQPSTWSWLHQPPENIDIEPLLQRDVLGIGSEQATHDTSIGHSTAASPFFAPGFHAIARGMVYYHRPGNWREHPNFFNPYWRPKLAPIGPVLDGLLTEAGGGGFLGTDDLTKRLVTH